MGILLGGSMILADCYFPCYLLFHAFILIYVQYFKIGYVVLIVAVFVCCPESHYVRWVAILIYQMNK